MKKKNYTMRIAAGVMTAALLSTCAISSTFAKYTSESTGTATARVAKWDILFGDETTMSETFTFDLYSTLYDTTANSAEADVKTGDDAIIAPGTQGSFVVKITNNSEVTAKYTVSFAIGYTDDTANTETVKSVIIPLQFSNDGSTNWTTDIATLNIADTAAVELGMTDSDKSATCTDYWKWDYENSNDANDTILGTAGAEIQITATVTATQVD